MAQNNIRKLRIEKGLSLRELGDKVGVGISTISNYESGTRQPDNDKLLKIASALDTTVSYLLGETEQSDRVFAVSEENILMPIIGSVAAGYGSRAEIDSEDEIEIPRSYLRGRPASDYFLLRVKGDSMYPLYMEGDIVLVLRQSTLNKSGDIGVIRYDEDEATLKKVEYVMGEDWMRLVPLNPEYKPKMIVNEDLEQCSVLGIPRMVIREVRQ